VNEGEAEKGDGSTEDVDDKRYKKAAGQQWHAGVQGCVVVGEVHLICTLDSEDGEFLFLTTPSASSATHGYYPVLRYTG
jgi:hypothetical protein